jgi:hypothetical protein
MIREKLQELLRQRPFQPFRVHLTDGRVYDIQFPEINLLGQSYINIGIPEPNNPDPFYDRLVYVPLSLISHLEPLPTAAPTESR